MYVVIATLLLLVVSLQHGDSFHFHHYRYHVHGQKQSVAVRKNMVASLQVRQSSSYTVLRSSSESEEDSPIVADTASDNSSIQLSPLLGFLTLNFVAILWGTQHVVIKSSLEDFATPSLLNFWRFALSTLLFAPSLISYLSKRFQENSVEKEKEMNATLRAGCELGFYTFLGFAFQAIGLETTTASKSAFLLYLNVKFVPFIAAIFFQKTIGINTWISAFLAFAGTCLLSTDGSGLNIGDAWCIAAAIASAMFILRLETFSKLHNAAELNGISFASVAVMCLLWIGGDITAGNIVMNDVSSLSQIVKPMLDFPLPVIYLGVITTGLCNFLQTIGQRTVPAERAAIIYSMDPVYGAFFSRWFLGEELGNKGYIGALLILLGIWVSSRAAANNNPTSADQAVEEPI